MVRKILEKVFITKKCTQCTTLHTLKTDALESQDNKNIGKLFSKYELVFLDQANISDPSQILILQFPIPHPYSFPASLAISVKFPPGKQKFIFNTILIKFFIVFLIFFYPVLPHATIIGYTKPHAKPIIFVIEL